MVFKGCLWHVSYSETVVIQVMMVFKGCVGHVSYSETVVIQVMSVFEGCLGHVSYSETVVIQVMMEFKGCLGHFSYSETVVIHVMMEFKGCLGDILFLTLYDDNHIFSLSYLQRYISNPLLLSGHKFDLRLYVLVSSFQPLEVFLYGEGFARLSTQPYTNDIRYIGYELHTIMIHYSPTLILIVSSIANQYIHLTNYAIQQHNSEGIAKMSADVVDVIDGCPPTTETPGFVFPSDPHLAGASKISLAYWRICLEKTGIGGFNLGL